MKRKLKLVRGCIFLIPAFPFALLCAFGRWKAAFTLFGQLLGIGPGLPGSYLRTAYYALTVEHFSLLAYTSFGTFFAHRETRVYEGADIGAFCIFGRVSIGSGARIASHVQVLSGQQQHTRDEHGRLSGVGQYTQIQIGENAWIGASAVIMADVGTAATVGAGSVIAASVAAGATVSGNPARAIRSASPASQ